MAEEQTKTTAEQLAEAFSSATPVPTAEALSTLPGNEFRQAFLSQQTMRPEATAEEKRGALLTGVGTGVPSGATVAGSIYAGMRAGAALPVPLQIKPFTTAGGAALGFGAGLTGSIFLNDLLESNVPAQYLNDPRLIPYYQGGRTFGETIGAAPLVFGIPEIQGGRIAKFVSEMRKEARRSPAATLSQEGFSGIGAGTAGAVALSYDPEGTGTRFGAELVGGMFAPPKALLSAAQNGKGILSSVMMRFSEDAREAQAAAYLRTLLEQTGEDPNKLITRLQQPLPSTIPEPSGAQKTGSLALTALENTLARGNSAFGLRLTAQGRATFIAYQNLMDGMRRVGDPEAIREAARNEQAFFNGLLSNRQTVAEQNAAQRIRGIQVDSPSTRQRIGLIVQDEMESALGDAREYERALWQQAELEAVNVQPGARGLEDAVVTPRTLRPQESSRNFLDAVTSVTPEYLRGMPGYSTAAGILTRFGINKKAIEQYEAGKLTTQYLNNRTVPAEYVTGKDSVPVSYMIKARGDLLSLARSTAASGDVNAARIYGEMAEGLLADMDSLNMPAYDRARAYSSELNDFFTRSYVRDLTASMRTGARRLPPEVLIARAFNSNTDVTAQRMQSVINAAGALDLRYQRLLQELGPDHPQVQELAPFAEASRGRLVSVADAQRQWLLLGANKALVPDPEAPNGVRVDRAKLNNFIVQNERYLQDAGLLADLQNVDTAQAALTAALDQNSAFNKGIKNQAAFSMMLGRENPTMVLTEALNGKNPVRTMRRVMSLAKQGGLPAIDGMKATVYDYAFTAAGGMSARFSPTAYYDALFEPMALNQPSLIQIMRNGGVVTQREGNDIKRLLIPMMRIESVSDNKAALDEIIRKSPSMVTDLALRVIGSRLSRLGGGSGESLVLAGAGSRMARDLFQNQPNIMIRDLLQNASQNPQLLADLLAKLDPTMPTSQETLRRVATQMAISGYSAGLPATINFLQYTPPERQDQTQGAFSTPYAPRPQPPAPATRGVGTPAPAGGAPAGGAPAPAPTPGPLGAAPQPQNSRAMLAQLFPFDATLRAGG